MEGSEADRFFPAPRSRRYGPPAGSGAGADESGNPQSPHRDCAFSRRLDWLRRRNPRRRRPPETGAKPKAGLTGFSVSNLRVPGFIQPWEEDFGKPGQIVSALEIMLEGPIGGAAFNNEFGRPALCGLFPQL